MRPIVLFGLLAVLLFAVVPAAAQSGERFEAMHTVVTVLPNGDVRFDERITVNFGSDERRGIIRDLRTRVRCGSVDSGPEPLYECPSGSDRTYPLTILSITDGNGQPLRHEATKEGANTSIRIGDPNVTITGRHEYRISYVLEGALNAFADHDELYWNVTGSEWALPLEDVEVRLRLPTADGVSVTCFEGYRSNAPCEWSLAGDEATFRATRTLYPGEELTIVAGWPKGVVQVQPPVLADRVSVDDFFTLDWLEWGGMALLAVLGVAGLGRTWWRYGRDRRYTSIYYLTDDPAEETAALFARQQIVVEYLPPDNLKPAQMGVIIDERADTLDVTATIIDLAVRGYLHIEEREKRGWFGKTDWELHQREAPEGDRLENFEQRLLNALFRERQSVKVSDLRTKFVEDLRKVKSDLYRDAMSRKWFSVHPEHARRAWAAGAVVLMVAGAGLAVAVGYFAGRALIPVPLVLAGLAMLPLSRAMARRTATGSEALRRVLGFKLYITVAETERQAFHEDQGIFARYLPFAIVFECVDKWAKAFEGLDDEVRESTSGWYSGPGTFRIAAFTAGLNSFSSNVSTAIQSTPGGSGGSGFSGGRSGGGGGGGGGRSW